MTVSSSGESGELSPHWVSRPRTPHHLLRGFAHPEFGHSAETVTAMGCGKRGSNRRFVSCNDVRDQAGISAASWETINRAVADSAGQGKLESGAMIRSGAADRPGPAAIRMVGRASVYDQAIV
jgi:hypothetical protein